MSETVVSKKGKIFFLDRAKLLGNLKSEREENLEPLQRKLILFLEGGYDVKADFLIHRVDRSDLFIRLRAVNLERFESVQWSSPDYPVCNPLRLSLIGHILGQVGLEYDHLKKTLEGQLIENVSIILLNKIPPDLAQQILAP